MNRSRLHESILAACVAALAVLPATAQRAGPTRPEPARPDPGGEPARGERAFEGAPFRSPFWGAETYGFGDGTFEALGMPARETSRARIRITGTGPLRVDRVRINGAILQPFDDYTVSAGGGTSEVTVNFLRGARPREGDLVEIAGRTQTDGEHVGRLQFRAAPRLPDDLQRVVDARYGADGGRDLGRPSTGERTGNLTGPPARVAGDAFEESAADRERRAGLTGPPPRYDRPRDDR